MNFSLKRRILQNEKGQATVELALILPLLLLIVMIIIFLGIFLFSKSVVLLSAHEGARSGILIWNSQVITEEEKKESVREAVIGAISSLPDGGNSDVIVTDNGDGVISVDVTYQFRMNLPFLEEITGSDSIPVHSKVSYRYVRANYGG
ncbi:MAG TPA: TadE/TadG family type IV pilus assembly protein [Anaerovoracaceae bacterium]|nr:TadE/TadG family type IV pilus assembly protein [Anaerovoracaceae bacterium]